MSALVCEIARVFVRVGLWGVCVRVWVCVGMCVCAGMWCMCVCIVIMGKCINGPQNTFFLWESGAKWMLQLMATRIHMKQPLHALQALQHLCAVQPCAEC